MINGRPLTINFHFLDTQSRAIINMNFGSQNKTSLKQVIPSGDGIEEFLSVDNIRRLPAQGYNINEVIHGKTLLMSAVCMVS